MINVEIHFFHSPDPCFSSFSVTFIASPNTEYRGNLWPMTIPTHSPATFYEIILYSPLFSVKMIGRVKQMKQTESCSV